MDSISGRFYFKLTANGNLDGEYSHAGSTYPLVESAQRVEPPTQVASPEFEGTYRSIWIEEDDEGHSAVLEISRKPGCREIFSLAWNRPEDSGSFRGEAMLCDKILVGNYWSV